MNQQSEDKELLNRIKYDEEKAFKELFRRYYRPLCYAAFKIYSDEHKAKDFAQEVFLDLWKRRKTIHITASVQAYLRRAVRNKAIDYIRAQRLNFEEEPLHETAKTTNTSATDLKELKEVIHQAVNQLPERCKIIFSMSRFEQLSHKEIATQLGISVKTIENQITKATKILRKIVAQYNTDLMLLFFWLIAQHT